MVNINEQSNFTGTMAKKAIYVGDEVICVHDTDDLKIGDRGIVKGICLSCGGLILDNSDKHHNKKDFELFLKSEPFTISRTLMYSAMKDLHTKFFFLSQQGLLKVDDVRIAINDFYKEIGVKDDFFKSTY